MDWAVRDRTHDQVARERGYMEHGWQCDFYFGYGLDVIEEEALNENSCIQVLRVLITKANTEILELEEDLITLQSQLAWADESWSEMCSAALREKIDCLDIAMQSVRNTIVQNEHDFGVGLLLYREPAERVHDIVKDLLANYFHQKDKQLVEVIVKESSSAGLQHQTDFMVEEKRLSFSTLETLRKEEVKEASIAPAQRCVILNSSLKSWGKKSSYAGTVKLANIVKASSLDSSTTAAGLTNGRKILSKLYSASNRILDASKYGMTQADSYITQKSSLKSLVKRRNHQEPGECPIIKDSSSDATDDSSEKKELSKFDLIINGKSGLKKHSSASKEKTEVLNSSLKPAWKGRNLPRTPSSASSSDASEHAISPKGNKKLSRIDSKVNGHKESEEPDSTDQSITLNSSLQLGGREYNISKTVEPADHSMEFSSSALQEVTEESDVNPKLSKAPDSAPARKINPPLSLKVEKKRIKTPRRMKCPAAGPTDTEQNAAHSLLELLNHKSEHITEQQPKDEQKQKAKLVANDDESNSNLTLKPQKQRAKREHQQKQKANSDSHAAKKQGVGQDVNLDSAPQSQKKRKCQSSRGFKVTKRLKGLHISVAKLCADTAESTSGEDLCIPKFSFTGDHGNVTPKLLPSPALPRQVPSGLDLECLSLGDLKAVAKQHNLRGYSKLTKAKLAEELGLKLIV